MWEELFGGKIRPIGADWLLELTNIVESWECGAGARGVLREVSWPRTVHFVLAFYRPRARRG